MSSGPIRGHGRRLHERSHWRRCDAKRATELCSHLHGGELGGRVGRGRYIALHQLVARSLQGIERHPPDVRLQMRVGSGDLSRRAFTWREVGGDGGEAVLELLLGR
mgnify:CR=1 FL=1